MTWTKSCLAGAFVFVLSSNSALSQPSPPWPGHVLCKQLIEEAGFWHEETQRWDITGAAQLCPNAPPGTPPACYPYIWSDRGKGYAPTMVNGHPSTATWTIVATGSSLFELLDRADGTHIHRANSALRVPDGTNVDGSWGDTDEWEILQGSTDREDIIMGAATIVSGGFIAKVAPPPILTPSVDHPVTCLYAFGRDGAAQQFLSAVSKGAGTFEVFGVDPWDNTVIRRKSFAGKWGPGSTIADVWGLIGPGPARGFVQSPPSAVALSSTEVHVFAVGADGAAYHNALSGSCVPTCQPGTWESIGRPVARVPGGFLGSIAAVSTSTNRIELLGLGSDGKAYRKSYDRNPAPTWTPAISADWQPIGGRTGVTLSASPAASSWGVNRFDIFASGSDGKVYHKYFDGAWRSWTALDPSSLPGSQLGDWEPIGGVPANTRIVGSPSVVSWGNGRLDIFVSGSDDKVYHKFFAGGRGWGPGAVGDDWEPIGGLTGGARIVGSPAAVSWASDRLDLFVTGGDLNVHHKFFEGSWRATGPGSQMGEWEPLGPAGQPGTRAFVGPPAAVSWGAGRLDIFAIDGLAKAYHKYFSAPSWGPGGRTANGEPISR